MLMMLALAGGFGCTCLSLDVVTAAAESHDARLGRVLVLVADAHDAQYLPQLKLMMLLYK